MDLAAGDTGATGSDPDGREVVGRLDVLGPCTVTGGATTDRPLTALQRRLLARLALGAPADVERDELVDALWPDGPPRTARAALHNQVSRTRALLGNGVIVTGADYALDVGTDVQHADRLVAEADDLVRRGEGVAAGRLLDEALALWRGVPYLELEHLPEADVERQRLLALRRTAETLRLRAALFAGRIAWAVPEAERLVADAPLDEQRWALLVTTLAQAGRRGDALGAVDRARRLLRTELGIEPGPALRAAEAAVLGAGESPGEGRADRLVGREPELEQLLGAIQRGGLSVVTGEAGAGRSALLAELARRARRSGVQVALVRCPTNPATATVTLVELLENLGTALDRNAGPVEGFRAAVADAAAQARVVLLVDDLHLAGPTTRRALDACAELDGVAIVASIAHDAVIDPPASTVELEPLAPAQVAQLAGEHLARHLDEHDPLVTWLTAMSGGNPLFVESLLDDREAVERWHARSPARPDEAPASPAALGDVIRARIERLGAATRETIETAAVCGPELPRALLVSLTSPAGVDAAEASGLLVGDGDTLAFRHGAVQRVLYDDVPPGRRLEIHHSAATALAASGHPAAVVAPHALAAVELDPVRAGLAAREAAVEATNQGAHRDAAVWYERAVEAARARGADGTHDLIAALVGLGDSLRLAGDRRHEAVLFEAADRAAREDDAELMGDAAFALLQLGATTESGALHERAVELAERAMARTSDVEQRAVIAAAASLAHSMSGHPDRCRALFLDAESSATSDGARRKVLPFAFLALGRPGDLDQRERLALELRDRSARADDAIGLFEARHLLFSVALQRADGGRVRSELAAMEELVDRVGDVGRRWAIGYQSAAVAHLDDDLDRSEQLAQDAMDLFAPVSPSRAFATYGSQLLVLRLAQGRIGELADTMRALVEDQPGVPAWHAALALAVAATSPAEGRTHAAAALEDVPLDFTWLAAHVIGGRAAAIVGDPGIVEAYRRRLEPWSGLVCWQGTCAYGPVDTVLAELAHASGDERAAERHAALAIERARSLQAPVFEREVGELRARW